jgi:hypothetical protein
MHELLVLRKRASELRVKLIVVPAVSVEVAQRSSEVIFTLNARIEKVAEHLVQGKYDTIERDIYLARTKCLAEAHKAFGTHTNWGEKFNQDGAEMVLKRVIQLDLELSQFDDLFVALFGSD